MFSLRYILLFLIIYLFFSCSDTTSKKETSTSLSIEVKKNNSKINNNTVADTAIDEYEIEDPSNYFNYMEDFQSVLGKVVFVKKNIFGGDLEYSCILRGKVKNITDSPLKNIYIIWNFWDEGDQLIEISPTTTYNPAPKFWVDKIDYLDSKSETNFNIELSLQDMSPPDGKAIKDAVFNGRHEACIFIMN